MIPGTEVVKRRSVRPNVNALNRRSWPLAPGVNIKQQLRDKERSEQLNEILNRYSASGLPPLPQLLAIGRPSFNEAIFEIESHWSQLMDNTTGLTKRQHDQQEAIWELLHTEVSYIKQLRVIIDVFQSCLINTQQEALLNEIETERLFGNIDQVYECNCRFWQDSLSKVLKESRSSRQLLNPSLLKEGFMQQFPCKFQVYSKYCIDHNQSLQYLKDCYAENDLFKMFILWAEAQKQCNRLKLNDLLVKPVQRLTKYSLLLQAILRKTDHERQRRDLLEMIGSVDKCVGTVNTHMKQQSEQHKMDRVIARIEPYDAVEGPNDESLRIIQEFNTNFNLKAPMPGFHTEQLRILIMHSNLRMKEQPKDNKVEVDCFLFTDLLLICKAKKEKKYKIIRPPMRLDQLVVSELRDKGSFLLIYMNEYHVPIAAFTFHHSEPLVIRQCLDQIRRAQDEFKEHIIQASAERQRQRTAHEVSALEEVEYHFLPTPGSEHELQPSLLPRTDSMESADHFVPNLLTPTPASSLANSSMNDLHAHDDRSPTSDFSRTGSYGDILESSSSSSPSRSRSVQTVLAQDRLTSSSPEHSPSNSRKKSAHKPVHASFSVPNITKENFPCSDSEDAEICAQQNDPLGPALRTHSNSEISEQGGEEETSRNSRLNQRRTEKRYHTADSIQDIKKKESSIVKRLSLTNHEVQTDRKLPSKATSSESVRSSRGVSSTGSLHLNVENEISEEGEGGSSPRPRGPRAQTFNEHVTVFHVGGGNDEDDDDSTPPSSSSQLSQDCKQSKSKSTSDIVSLFSKLTTSSCEGGIASVELPSVNPSVKLSHAQMMKMKQHLLLNDANVESSEV